MLFAKNTPNNTGIAIYGDCLDFENLHKSLHKIVVKDDVNDAYFPASTRVLSVCYDIRHSLMGHRDYEFVDNGLNNEKKRKLSIVAPNKNMYYKINILWPEVMFLMMALNDLIEIYTKKTSRLKYSNNLYAEPKVIWDSTIVNIRSLQAAIYSCIEDTIPKGASTRLVNLMNNDFINTSYYLTQYVDKLNDRFLKMSKENRLKNISIFAKRIAEKNEEYNELRRQFTEEAKKKNCNIIELSLAVEYPDEIEW